MALEGPSCSQEYMDRVVNKYFSTFHWKLKVTEDPAPSRTVESGAPAPENLSSIEAKQKSHKVLAMHKAICSWLGYCIKTHKKIRRLVKPENNLGPFKERCAAKGKKGKQIAMFPGMHDSLGMHVTLLVEGPEPRKQGQITVLSMHEGADHSPVPRNWQLHDKQKYKVVTRMFQDYLSMCYTQEEHNACKLPPSLEGLIAFGNDTPPDNNVPMTPATSGEIKEARAQASQEETAQKKYKETSPRSPQASPKVNDKESDNSHLDKESHTLPQCQPSPLGTENRHDVVEPQHSPNEVDTVSFLDWFHTAVMYLHTPNLPICYQELLSANIRCGTCTQQQRLSRCPSLVDIKSMYWLPPIRDLNKFRTEFWAWWSTLQPKWRVLPLQPSTLPTTREVAGNWTTLDKPRLNGFLSILAALKWWGSGLVETGRQTDLWDAMVNNVCWVINWIINSCLSHSDSSSSKKHPLSMVAGLDNHNKKKKPQR
ncbi:hypothetical protein PAXRUDRAFT_27823 [Paxillus rubicundulus Ve08.2h10]|uniref:Uncharacterized protein n=1 Tax=Paxillus rubicundulus Ve08.2h10 TaxID=930991 RepID=A0A0D0D0R8_9AGAM|nr:hypothetical protein PAXRUDRAFT_27823 [Paxillus rubicundulus Ve08.2h10]